MTAFVTSRPMSTGIMAAVGARFFGAFAAVQQWNDERVTRNALSKLSDRELEDIGLTRGDIDTVAKRGF